MSRRGNLGSGDKYLHAIVVELIMLICKVMSGEVSVEAENNNERKGS